MKVYRHLFFDLDRTLWDFDRNSLETLKELFKETHLQQKGIPDFDTFINYYHQVNDELWALYRKGEISREVLSPKRFQLTFEAFGLDDPDFPHWFGEEYLRRSATRDHTFANARQVLDYLAPNYLMHILTNGFEKVQRDKLERSDLRKYFDVVLSSEEIGISKPEPGIFVEAMKRANTSPEECLMIGDDEKVDILGAQFVGMDQVWFNPEGNISKSKPTYEIRDLAELKEIL